MKFNISSQAFNELLKRLVTLSGKDPTAIITFVLNESKLELFYRSKLDETDTFSLFNERIPLESSTGKGTASMYLNNLFNIKVPEFNEDRYPQCKEIEFSFNESILDVKFNIKWNKEAKNSLTKLHFPLAGKDESLDDFSKLYDSSLQESYFTFDNRLLHESIGLCNFLKTDVTGKHSNGCLIKVEGDHFLLVNTDSNVAIKYETNIVNSNLKKEFQIVISNPVLNAIKTFLPEDKQSKISHKNGKLLVAVENRLMLVPVMKVHYIIDQPTEFFAREMNHVGNFELKPCLLMGNALLNKIPSEDLYSRFNLKFAEAFGISTSIDSTSNLPSSITKPTDITINGNYFITACQRLFNVGVIADLFFNDKENQIKLVSDDQKLTFLIQGLNF